MDDNDFDGEHLANEDDTPLRDRKSNSKALKTLGVDTSARKQAKMLGLDNLEYHKALKEACDSIDEPLAGGHSIEIPDEQIIAQLHARRKRRSSSCSPDSRNGRHRQRRPTPAASSSDNVTGDGSESGEYRESDSIPSYDYNSDNEPQSDGAARVGRRSVRSRELEADHDEEEGGFDLERRRWRSPSTRGLIDTEHEDGPLSTSAPNRYFYYYYDGQRRQPRRRRASFDCEQTPMIDKRANRKALSVLGINPSEEKVMDLLGIEGPEALDAAVLSALNPELPTELPQGRVLQPKALATLGLPAPPSKADLILGRYEAIYERELMDFMLAYQLQSPFI
jgi:hypothetical protein